MSAARLNQDATLYAAVRRHLRYTVADLKSAECTSVAIEATLATVYSAVADFSEEWNSTAPSMVPALPLELIVECFKLLTHKERVTASHVSRAWRAKIVGTSIFWTTVCIPVSMESQAAISRFRHHISRSGSAVLDVRFGRSLYHYHSDEAEIRRLFRESMPRIRSLVVGPWPGIEFFTELRAPALESLRLTGTSRWPDPIPGQWIHTSAPRLRSLTLDAFAIPTNAEVFPLRNIQEFEGYSVSDISILDGQRTPGARTIFSWFPCLVSLKLTGIRDTDDLPQMLPPTLRSVQLFAKGTVDFSPILDKWTSTTPAIADGKRSLRFDTEGPPALNAALRHVATAYPSTPANVSLKFQWESKIVFSASSGSGDEESITEVTLASALQTSFITTHDLRGNPYLGTIRSISLSGPSLISFLRADLDLPALQTLSIKDYPRNEYDSSVIGLAIRRDLPPLRAPRSLQEITLDLSPVSPYTRPLRHGADGGADEAGTAALLADFLATRVLWPSQPDPASQQDRLARIIIVKATPPSWEAVSGLQAFASKIYYEESVDRVRREMSPRPPPPSFLSLALSAIHSLQRLVRIFLYSSIFDEFFIALNLSGAR